MRTGRAQKWGEDIDLQHSSATSYCGHPPLHPAVIVNENVTIEIMVLNS